MRTRRALILGVSGQDGAYLADFLLSRGYEVFGTSRDPAATAFDGLERLQIRDRVTLHALDPSQREATQRLLESLAPQEIYCLAGQSSVGLSFERPWETFSSVIGGALNVLEAARVTGLAARIFLASSTECFGECMLAATEETPLAPRNPYAAAKTAATWLARSYRASYGMFVVNGFLGSHESPLRSAGFVTRKIAEVVNDILEGRGGPLELGNVDIRREWGWAPEYVEAFWLSLQARAPEDFILSTGESRSLLEFTQAVFCAAGLDWQAHLVLSDQLRRPTEVLVTQTRPVRAAEVLGWKTRYGMADVASGLLRSARDGTLGWIPWRD